MIRDDHRHSFLLCKRNLLTRCNSIITGQQGIYPILQRFLYQLLVESIAILYPVRYHCRYLYPQCQQAFLQYVSCCDTIHIIVPNNTDPLSLFDLLQQDLHTLFGIFEQIRAMKLRDRPVQKIIHLFFCGKAAVAE